MQLSEAKNQASEAAEPDSKIIYAEEEKVNVSEWVKLFEVTAISEYVHVTESKVMKLFES